MFHTLGRAVSHSWYFWLVGWLVVLTGLIFIAPEWDNVVEDGEFRYLPSDVPSHQGEEVFQQAFSKDLLGSAVVIVVRRESREEGLLEEDKTFIEEVLKPRLREIAMEHGGLAADDDEDEAEDPTETPEAAAESQPAEDSLSSAAENNEQIPLVSKIRTLNDKSIGHFLESDDKKAALVFIGLTTEFLALRNQELIEEVEKLIGQNGTLQREGLVPLGLDLKLSGSATVGRDMRNAAEQSSDATHLWTILLVVVLLVLIYRAPVLAFVPLMTVYVSVSIALIVLALLAQQEIVELFKGIEIYVTVVLYGAGIDYCMFLMARYKEELDAGASYDEAIANSVAKVGSALAASAGTTAVGIGMMAFAEFGKFQQAGLAMSFSLLFVLCAALTFAPAMLRLTGRWAFWPQMRTERIRTAPGWLSPTNMISRVMESAWASTVWDRIGDALLKRPLTIWAATVAVLLPFVFIAIWCHDMLSYGLLSELPKDQPSVIGAQAVQSHFPAGVTGPVTVLLQNDEIDFTGKDRSLHNGPRLVDELGDRLGEVRDELQIADIRSSANIFGISETAERQRSEMNMFELRAARHKANDYYVADVGEYENHVARIDVIFKDDPFSRGSIDRLNQLEQHLQEVLPEEYKEGTNVYFIGPTASIRDLKAVTGRDQIRIDVLVISGVFVILVILLRRLATAAYLIFSVFFSYLVALGVTYAVFWALDPAGFAGLDWKVPIFLFTILIAVGEDYNIYLITRIDEERREHGTVKGVTVALRKTGSIISSCGIIMAGTFSSLLAGSLAGINQLGFALAFGVMLDTFVVRPILVPAYLILLHSGRFGALGKYLGAEEAMPEVAARRHAPPEPSTVDRHSA